MRRLTHTWMVMLLVFATAGCTTGLRTAAPIYQDDFLTVRLEPNPDGSEFRQTGKYRPAISSQQLAGALSGLQARKVQGFLQSVGGQSQFESVFRADELPLVARELKNGLKMATEQERVVFQAVKVVGGYREETQGAIFVRGPYLYVALTKFRSSNRMDYASAEGGSGRDFGLLFEPGEAVVQKQEEFASRWLAGGPAEVIIDIQKVPQISEPKEAGALPGGGRVLSPVSAPSSPGTVPPKNETAVTSQAPSVVTMEALQRQIKELTDSNHDLRGKFKELGDRRDQSQAQADAAVEEAASLRQELAETKQLLADKVMELNRLKSKQKGSNKGKSQAPPPP